MQPVAVVTGVGRRLGRYLTDQLLDQGYRVFGQYHTSRVSASGESSLHLTQVDFRDSQALERWCQQILALTDRVDLLINNASLYQPDADTAADGMVQLTQCHQIHLQAPYLLMMHLNGRLQHAQGQIVNLTDIYIHHPNEDYSLYCATKAGLDSLTQSWARSLAPAVRVNSIEPGPILFLDEHSAEYRQQILARTLLQVEGGLEPIWQALWMLINNPYMTGARIPVDGGRSVAKL
ncbi:dihydromonapterin reductase / dihydrofolate reductase [Ferrimonas sediminum]|uniref:Dihydromonapterin reductase n=1 Tax=Ferrimonas sediminum TaxID=718193 RepID=A0A1G8YPR6_9GAMM|nr:SDR family oxidoreductase [Ferrimonas sediminum]SDK04778.1 dihydromonapterin reductase / dihydrofolate reductase [Ferrimonas sediminum]